MGKNLLQGFMLECDPSTNTLNVGPPSPTLAISPGRLVIAHPNDDFSPTGYAPEIHWSGLNGSWGAGIDVAAATPNRDFAIFKIDYPAVGSVKDTLYISHNGSSAPPSVGVGIAQPAATYALRVAGYTEDATQGALAIHKPTSQTGNLLTVFDGTGESSPQVVVNQNFALTVKSSAAGSATIFGVTNNSDANRFVVKQSDSACVGIGGGSAAATPDATLVIHPVATNTATLRLRASSNGHLLITAQVASANVDISTANASALRLGTNGTTRITLGAAGELGFYGATAVAKPTVSGAKGSNAALGSLMTALSNLGLVTDSTTA